jgi:hypothetical protein
MIGPQMNENSDQALGIPCPIHQVAKSLVGEEEKRSRGHSDPEKNVLLLNESPL